MSRPPIPTTTSPYWVEQARIRRIREATDILAEQREEAERLAIVPIEPCRITPESRTPVVARPGSHHAAAAFKSGSEDEYIDVMQGRYGGDH